MHIKNNYFILISIKINYRIKADNKEQALKIIGDFECNGICKGPFYDHEQYPISKPALYNSQTISIEKENAEFHLESLLKLKIYNFKSNNPTIIKKTLIEYFTYQRNMEIAHNFPYMNIKFDFISIDILDISKNEFGD